MSEQRILENPLLVLGVPATATRMEIERAGQKLLAELAIGTRASQSYQTPFGPRDRDESTVRAALAALRNPEERLLSELWLDPEPGRCEATERGAAWVWQDAAASICWRKP